MNQDLDNPLGTFAEFVESMKIKIKREELKHSGLTKWDTRLWIEYQNYKNPISCGNVEKAIDKCIERAAKAYIVAVSLKKRGVK